MQTKCVRARSYLDASYPQFNIDYLEHIYKSVEIIIVLIIDNDLSPACLTVEDLKLYLRSKRLFKRCLDFLCTQLKLLAQDLLGAF